MPRSRCSIDGQRVKMASRNRRAKGGEGGSAGCGVAGSDLDVPAGPRDIGVSFHRRSCGAPVEALVVPYRRGLGHRSRRRSRPSDDQWPDGERPAFGDTPARRRVFICHPSRAASDDLACASRILSTLGSARVSASGRRSADVDPLLAFYRKGRAAEGGFELGIRRALERLLVEPRFLFQDRDRRPLAWQRSDSLPLTDLEELASRLSFFLWSSIPDDELLDVASAGRLHTRSGRVRASGAKDGRRCAVSDALIDEFPRPVAVSARSDGREAS